MNPFSAGDGNSLIDARPKPKAKRPVTVGEILREEFLTKYGIEPVDLARNLNVPTIQVTALLDGRCGCQPSMALRLALYFGGTPEFWMNIQTQCDFYEQRDTLEFTLKAIVPHASAAELNAALAMQKANAHTDNDPAGSGTGLH